MQVLFYGTPLFALPTLEALLAAHTVVGVVTQPDRPAGRGRRLTPSPVKERALAARLPVLQPARLRDPTWVEPIRALRADVAVVVAFGQILPRPILDAPTRGSINVHASLLPTYRGAAPIAWAVIRGERDTGITTFQMDDGLDTGPLLLSERTPIGPDETAGELAERLAVMGGRVLIETLARLDHLTPTPQRHEEATFAPRLTKADGRLDWSEPASALVNRIRGCNPWPGAWTGTASGRLIVWRARLATAAGTAVPGTLVSGDGPVPVIACGSGALEPLQVQPASRRALAWVEYLRGARLAVGARVGDR